MNYKEKLEIIYRFIEDKFNIVGQTLVGSIMTYNGYDYQVLAEVNGIVYMVCTDGVENGEAPEFCNLSYKSIESNGFELQPPRYTIWYLLGALAQIGSIRVINGNELCNDNIKLATIDFEEVLIETLAEEELDRIIKVIKDERKD